MSRVRGAFLLILSGLCGCASLSEPARKPPEIVELGTVRVDIANREVLLDGFVNMTGGGIVELLACGPRGKTHESVLVVEAEARDVQAALLLLGMEPGGGPTGMGVGRPFGPELNLHLSWMEAAGLVEIPAEEALWIRDEERPLPETGWTFTGSMVYDGRFMAEVDQSLVATFWDPWAILNLPLEIGGDDTLLYPNAGILPAEGTRVRLRMTPAR